MSELGERLEALVREIVREELKAQPTDTQVADPRVISEPEFCERVGISRSLARRLRRDGKLKFIRVHSRRVLYTLEQVEEFLKAHEIGGRRNKQWKRLKQPR